MYIAGREQSQVDYYADFLHGEHHAYLLTRGDKSEDERLERDLKHVYLHIDTSTSGALPGISH
ncbi:MAG: hypothetical protein ACI83D_000396 [Planctomycetota bacterium]|jgi:hypothetical protein